MTKSKQTYNRINCFSPGRIIDDGRIELAVVKNSKKIAGCVHPDAREEDSIISCIPIETNFFYLIEKYSAEYDCLYKERGIAEIINDDGRSILNRLHVFSKWDTEQKQEIFNRKGSTDLSNLKGWFDVSTYTPIHTSQLFISEHSVLCSIDKGTPATVPLEEATLLGRLDDRIQSIDSDELKFILGDNVRRALEESQGPIKLSAKELSLNGRNSIIMTDQIRLNPKKQRPRRFSVGSLYYNEKKKAFEFHDGEKWRRLVAE